MIIISFLKSVDSRVNGLSGIIGPNGSGKPEIIKNDKDKLRELFL